MTRIISDIELIFMKKIEASKALLIFDEIQLEMKAITALKYFTEMMPDIHIIGVGSLLGVAVNRERFSFPDGIKSVPLYSAYLI
jgi:predicted AAA+ superfamily ATPase